MRLNRNGENCMELPPQIQHRARGEVADGGGEVEVVSRPGLCGARAVAELMGLGPEPVTYRARTYLAVVRLPCHSPVFSVPVGIPKCIASVATGSESTQWLPLPKEHPEGPEDNHAWHGRPGHGGGLSSSVGPNGSMPSGPIHCHTSGGGALSGGHEGRLNASGPRGWV